MSSSSVLKRGTGNNRPTRSRRLNKQHMAESSCRGDDSEHAECSTHRPLDPNSTPRQHLKLNSSVKQRSDRDADVEDEVCQQLPVLDSSDGGSEDSFTAMFLNLNV